MELGQIGQPQDLRQAVVQGLAGGTSDHARQPLELGFR